MKKGICLILVLSFMIILNGCGENNSQSVTSNNTKVTKEDTGRANMTDLSAITTVEELEEYITNDVEDTLNKLKTDQEKLTSEINTYEKYVDNVTKVEAYYNETLEETNQLGIRLREYSLKYAQLVLDMQNGYDEKYDELDGIYDCIYEDAGDDMYDIYDVILQNLYDTYYDGILEDGYDLVPYEEWFDTQSKEYELWSDTRSDVYDIWSDTKSEIYDFCMDIKGEVYDRDDERIQEIIEKFTEDITDLKSNK